MCFMSIIAIISINYIQLLFREWVSKRCQWIFTNVSLQRIALFEATE